MRCPNTPVALALVLAAVVAPLVAGCGKKGPPQPIVHIVPTSPGALSVRQIGSDVVLTSTLAGTRTDGTKLDPDAELRVLRMPATDSLRPGAVSNRYLIIQFDRQAKVVASFDEKALAPYVLGGRLLFVDHDATAAGAPAAGAAADGSPAPAAGGAKKSRHSKGSSAAAAGGVPVKGGTSPAGGAAADSGAVPAGASAAPRLPRYLYALQVVEPKGRKSMLRTPSMLEVCHAPQAPVDLTLETAEGEVRLDWKPGEAPASAAAPAEPPAPGPAQGAAGVPGPGPPAPPAEQPGPQQPSAPASEPSSAPPAVTASPHPATPLFNVYRRLKSETRDPEAPLNAAALDAPSFIDRSFQYDVEYVYFVRATTGDKSSSCESASGAPVEVKPHDRFAPSAPTGLAVTAEGDVIRVYWFPNSEADLGGYRVYRREGDAAETAFLADVPATETSYIDTGAQRGVRYYYSVSAVDTATPINESPRSEERSEMLSIAPGGATPGGAKPGRASPPGRR